MSDNEFKTAEPFALPVGPPDIPVCPPLWNPDAAACWSFLFSPIFGSCLLAANWRALGKPEKAATNMVWVWGNAGFFLLAFIISRVSYSSEFKVLEYIIGIGLL